MTSLTNAETSAASTTASSNNVARVTFVSGVAPSGYGKTSPEPDPTWEVVSKQLALRLPNFSGNKDDTIIETRSIQASILEPNDLKKNNADIVIALGVSTPEEERRLLAALDYEKDNNNSSFKAILADPSCSKVILERRMAGSYDGNDSSILQDVTSQLIPWSDVASGKRLLEKTNTLLDRKSSEDYIFAVLFCINALVTELDVVKSDINPSWEKGVVRNIQEFKKMTDCCGPQIATALGDPTTKNAIDLLNAVDLRDQVGSYRVIVSNETPELEEFTLCILQQNDCFNCDAPILDLPRVPLMQQWNGAPVDDDAARHILIGHLDHPSSHPQHSQKLPWSWKIVVGANPAYDAFPMQHQIFYPSESSSKSLWYDPVFCVETLSEELVWCKRHYRCSPRKHWSSSSTNNKSPGAWTFTTLDNGMMSEERWTTVDAADDLSWAVLHYSGAAKRAGQSYVGALLCTPDGVWPTNADDTRIQEAFRKCDLELWELFGGSKTESFMWSDDFKKWAEQNPPPLERIGDLSINAWRKQEREKAMNQKQQ